MFVRHKMVMVMVMIMMLRARGCAWLELGTGVGHGGAAHSAEPVSDGVLVTAHATYGFAPALPRTALGSVAARLLSFYSGSKPLNGLQCSCNRLGAGLGPAYVLLFHEPVEEFLDLRIAFHTVTSRCRFFGIGLRFGVHFASF